MVWICRNAVWKPTRNSPGPRDLESYGWGRARSPVLFLCVKMTSFPASIADMFCHIYRSNSKIDTYLYLLDKDDFSVVPDDLLRLFGPPEFSFSFDLTEERKLAKEDSVEVLKNLEGQGYHLQLQDDILVEQILARKGLN